MDLPCRGVLLEAETGQGCMSEHQWTCHAGFVCTFTGEAETVGSGVKEEEWTLHVGRGVGVVRNGLVKHIGLGVRRVKSPHGWTLLPSPPSENLRPSGTAKNTYNNRQIGNN
jgi:hypothetical protein